MKIVSLDCSTAQASAALLEQDEVCFEECWITERNQHEHLVDHIDALMKKSGWRWDDIGLFVVGRGPGSYSGLRASLLAAQALAAPGGTPVIAVSSMDALAWRLLEEEESDAILIVGDARRQSFWLGHARREMLGSTPIAWQIVSAADAAHHLDSGLIATPHWDATAALRLSSGKATWLPESRHPTAADVARLALLRISQSSPPEPLTPLYLHAAV